jgi:hypothetical protein
MERVCIDPVLCCTHNVLEINGIGALAGTNGVQF